MKSYCNTSFLKYINVMTDSLKIQTGINNISSEWFRAKIDRKKAPNDSRNANIKNIRMGRYSVIVLI